MPSIRRHAAPTISRGVYSPGTGATYAALGQAAAHRNGSNNQDPMQALGLQFAQQGMHQQFARQQHQQALYDKQQADQRAQADANGFLDDLAQSAPDVISDPEFHPFGAAIAHGAMHPKDALVAYEAAKKSKAQRDATDAQNKAKNEQANRGLDIRGQAVAQRGDYQNAMIPIHEGTLANAINRTNTMKDQGQQRIDNAASLHAMPKAGAIINDPEYRSAADSLKYHREMAQLAQHQIDQSVFTGADATPMVAERDAHISAAKEAAAQSQAVLQRMRTPGANAPQQAGPAQPPPVEPAPATPVGPPQPQTDPRLTQHTLDYLKQNPDATDEEIKASFLQRYQNQE